MGFTTWNYDATDEAIEDTYDFLTLHGDIYAEQIDEFIPWDAWLTDTELPERFVQVIDYKVAHKIPDSKLLLSVSLLDTDRSELLNDIDGTIPEYDKIDDDKIVEAYAKHLLYLIDRFQPDYLVIAMEVNELYIKDNDKWFSYKNLHDAIQAKINSLYPSLPLAASVTLHNWYQPEVSDKENYHAELSELIADGDFAAISFYPFLKGMHKKSKFQNAFDFLHERVSLPILMVETNHLAETLELKSFNLTIKSDECEQKEYLEVLLENAQEKNYEGVIWWSHRDYDQLWETFPEEVKDVGKLWRDTGILNEDGDRRAAFDSWEIAFQK
ncbi:hypothetical protein GCM10007940_19290 [Portibacter lacus]|uniref:Arabinogalactan endo-beta-1,4-galactanase n=2 Tax=Portibacter lacus TaxID=1099794 RepID=A0AA37SPE3_9BACT|nr:hypothetical protein GCM10007940_19290 [Portibacter lacus]